MARFTTDVFYAFDLLYLDGYDVTGVKLEARKELLQRLIEGSKCQRIVYCDHIVGKGPEVFEQASQMGVEGVLSKRRDRPYRKGRTPNWKKAKCTQSEGFVIGGYTAPSDASYGFAALLLGQFDEEGRLQYAGRVGTGFTDTTRKQLFDKLHRCRRDDSPFARLPEGVRGRDVQFVEPKCVAHVVYLEWTGDSRLRHPSFRGLREDLTPQEAAHEERAPEAQILPANLDSLPDIRFTHSDKVVYPDLHRLPAEPPRCHLHRAVFDPCPGWGPSCRAAGLEGATAAAIPLRVRRQPRPETPGTAGGVSLVGAQPRQAASPPRGMIAS